VSIHDAEPNDIYVDQDGKLWRVLWTLSQPSVGVEAVEPNGYIPPPEHTVNIATGQPLEGVFLREHRQGGVSGIMWNGFKRIYRKDKK
jgi:hypothetical protein